MRRLLQLRASEDRGLAPDPDAGLTGDASAGGAAPAIRFRDPQIEMAHGAGGKASRRLVDGLFAPLLFERAPATATAERRRPRRGRRRAASPSRPTASSSRPLRVPRRLDRRAGGERHGERPRGARRPAGGAGRRPSCSKPGCPTEMLAGRSARDGAARRGRRASRSSAATPRSSSTARRTGCTSRPPASGSRCPACTLGARRCGPATRCSCPARSAITASRSCWRAASSTSRPSSAPTRARCSRWSRRWSTAAAPGIRWMRDPTRGGVATSLNELARDCGLAVASVRGADPGARRGARRLRAARARPAAHRQRRAVPRRGRARSRPTRRSGAARRRPAASEARDHRRGARASPRGAVLVVDAATAARGSSTCWWAIRCRRIC